MLKFKRAFTLIELLVVISIIALLLSITMPVMAKMKEAGKRVVCLNNLKQLTLAWTMYNNDNDGKMCDCFAGAPGAWINFTMVPQTVQEYRYAMEKGVLWSYINDESPYRCPTGLKGELITYASFPWWGWQTRHLFGDDYGTVILNIGQLKNSALRFVFTDEGRLTTDFYAVHYKLEAWWDQPLFRHSEGQTFSFADGHVEHYKWRDQRTKDACGLSWVEYESQWKDNDKRNKDNPDTRWVIRSTWGELGFKD